MNNIFKRSKTYYYRINVPAALEQYFSQKNLYVKSLKTFNKREAIILANFLNSKFNYVKSQAMLLSNDELKAIIEDFKSTNVESIKNRHKHLTINQIEKLINYYNNNEINAYDNSIAKEVEELSRVLIEHNIDALFDTEESDIDFLVDKIVQIKLNVLHHLKDDVNKVVVKDIPNKAISNNNNSATIEDCRDLFLESHDKKLRYEQNINLLIKFLNNKKIKRIEDITHSIIKAFRNDYYKTSKNSKTTTNQVLTHLSTFFKFCKKERLYSYENPIQDSHFDLNVREQANSQRDFFSDEDFKKILENLHILQTNQRTNKLRKYASEYEAIILIGAYTGARESEIIQLKRDDVLQEEESKINYFRFILDIDEEEEEEDLEESLKNTNSWRFVPIHQFIEPFILEYVNNMDKRRKNLFTITPKQFGKDFSKFKTSLGFGRKLVFHSFRHSVANKLKNQARDEKVGQEITGHAKNTTFNRYAKSYDLINKKEVLDKIYYKLD